MNLKQLSTAVSLYAEMDIRKKGRHSDSPIFRKYYCLLAKMYTTKYNYNRIGKQILRDHSSVTAAIKSLEPLLEVDKKIRVDFEKCENFILSKYPYLIDWKKTYNSTRDYNNFELNIKYLKIKKEYKNLLDRVRRLEAHKERVDNLLNIEVKLEKVEIKPNSVIYCDIPYKGTVEYKKGGFKHEQFYKWAIENENPVFISEYYMPDDFKIIASYHHKSTLSATNNDKVVVENLYWNGKTL